ncbi:MAG: homogentisate 1,2-dioxygenase [Candidatus Eisenbacteria bacterium]|nr:homogentisate 1,2-dioxygenase [Candidatus Eisenbacteria bacterium]
MPLYHRIGRLPKKRHIAFRSEEGSLRHEELMGNEGFSGLSSLLYHIHPPTMVKSAGEYCPTKWHAAEDPSCRHRHFLSSKLPREGNAVEHRRPLLWNSDVAVLIARPTTTAGSFYRNGQADELIYVSDGDGVLVSPFGRLPYRRGDYLVIPRGIIHRLELGASEHRLLILESRGVIRTPKRYRNAHGQHHEMSPFSERDFRLPEAADAIDQSGDFPLLVKQRNGLHAYVLARHPFDVVGWDGYYYPWAFNLEDFEPRVGLVHLPPPVHQVFEGDGFVVCNFVPRIYDFHPEAIPVPYHHTNAQSDEVLYYASDRFMSRRGIEYGSITHHPDGIAHGPHPGLIEPSIGATSTDERAVMIDTFRPLAVGRAAEGIEDKEYWRSWLAT